MLLNPGNVVITKLSPIENALGEKFCPAAIHTYEECKKTGHCCSLSYLKENSNQPSCLHWYAQISAISLIVAVITFT